MPTYWQQIANEKNSKNKKRYHEDIVFLFFIL
ncbi:hypothetical protein D2A66_13240 [Enterococcus faecalis]|uniref:Uncharacterized protein n=2 Tax=Enterococcus faecalis TaxID=1351 RepID=Q838H1_ENTFA|nr:hypothetical protein EF_0478 [Enterococcus faecalis V583]AXG87420.1 hypothetical protein DTO64_02075 [Enterococcus faecalis]AYZ06285.1 hypothetical protein EGX75_02995 [Enterococcus faecalis]EGO8532305.1 hypothetical protein [Enterococcus faecalis]EGO8590195.1 hypothetical protein [Enterococcus faecalis]